MTEQFFVVIKWPGGLYVPMCGPYDHKTDATAALMMAAQRAVLLNELTWGEIKYVMGTTDPALYAHFTNQVARVKTHLIRKGYRANQFPLVNVNPWSYAKDPAPHGQENGEEHT